MVKNNKGVTMIALIITIIVLIILVGVSVGTGFSVIKNMKASRMIANMSLVKAKVETIYEEYQFYQDTDYLIGEGTYQIDSTTKKLDEIEFSEQELNLIANKAEIDVSDIYDWDWYKWDTSVLESQGLDTEMLSANEYFYVNYEHSEIIYSNGALDDDSNYLYSMTGINTIK